MRRQPLGSGPMPIGQGYDDLGWNDMGYDVDPDQNAAESARMVDLKPLLAGSVLEHNAAAEHAVDAAPGHALTPGVGPDLADALSDSYQPEAVELPQVVLQQESLIDRVAAVARKVEARPEPSARKERAPRAQRAREKAAFTLRLDAERHLRLRLASAARGRSAQLLVTEALDALLAQMPEIDALRGQLPPTACPGE